LSGDVAAACARRRDILQQFISEAVAVIVIGGILGILASLLVLPTLGLFEVPVEWSLLYFVLPFSGVVAAGLLAAIFPALRAARLDPVAALAQE